MAYNEALAQRLRAALDDRPDVAEKKMFGGLSFLVGGNMCVGVIQDELMVRVGKAGHENALEQPYARIMDFTGRPMAGWVVVAPEGFASNKELESWVQRGLSFALTLPAK